MSDRAVTNIAARRVASPLGHCPHCGARLPAPLGPRGGRCGECRLGIGPGRAIGAADAPSAVRGRARSWDDEAETG